MASTSVILSGPSDWEQWYKDTLATVPWQMYKYFEPNTVAVLNKPVTSTKPVDKPAPEGVEESQV